MSNSLGRNEKCSCGSGKKFKKCHGIFEIKAPFEFKDIQFKSDGSVNGICLTGHLFYAQSTFLFTLFMIPLDSGKWQVKRLDWQHPQPDLNMQKTAEWLIVNQATTIITTTNMWSEQNNGGGAKILMNEIRVPDSAIPLNYISFRMDLLYMPSPDWSEMWDRINTRISADPYFRVHGFSTEEIVSAVKELKNIFINDWVRAKYRAANLTNNPPKMNDDFSQKEKSWFPAYHLARTAIGAICVDPAWNYLIEIGLSIKELKGFQGLDSVLKELCRNSGSQHHLCLAAELYKKGYLTGLESPTGSGSATNDLLVSVNGNTYAIEVKEFTSKNPLKVLIAELKDKAKKLPKNLSCAVVFHIVLREETASTAISKEQEFLNSLESLPSEIPLNISAVVVGSRFVDSMGGRIKRNTNKIILNASSPLNIKDDLEVIFEKNYSEIYYPVFGIGSFFYFSKS